jgi:hypothetical protein
MGDFEPDFESMVNLDAGFDDGVGGYGEFALDMDWMGEGLDANGAGMEEVMV